MTQASRAVQTRRSWSSVITISYDASVLPRVSAVATPVMVPDDDRPVMAGVDLDADRDPSRSRVQVRPIEPSCSASTAEAPPCRMPYGWVLPSTGSVPTTRSGEDLQDLQPHPLPERAQAQRLLVRSCGRSRALSSAQRRATRTVVGRPLRWRGAHRDRRADRPAHGARDARARPAGCCCSTGTRWPTARSSPCRSRTSRPPPASRPTRSTASPRCSSTCCATRRRRHVAVAFDLAQPTFRHEAYAEYKATRIGDADRLPRPGQPDPRGARGAGHPVGVASPATRPTTSSPRSRPRPRPTDMDVLIVTGDRDALQLVDDRVTVLMTRRGISDMTRFTPEAVREQVRPDPGAVSRLRGAARRPQRQPARHPGRGREDRHQVGPRVRLARRARRPGRRGARARPATRCASTSPTWSATAS